MKINDCYINTVTKKFNISICMPFEYEGTNVFCISFEEVLDRESFKELKKDSFLKIYQKN